MAASHEQPIRLRLPFFLRLPWRRITMGIVKGFLILFVGFMTLYFLLDSTSATGRLNSIFVLTLSCISLAYLLFVSSRVRLQLPGIDTQATEATESTIPERLRGMLRGMTGVLRKKSKREAQQGDVVTIQVSRLDVEAARVTIVNEAPLPVLRARTTLSLVQESEDEKEPTERNASQTKGKPFSLRAHSTRPTALSGVFEHVGIFRLHSAGIRIYSLLGLFSCLRGTPGQWRVRVVPNIYRIPYGVPKKRRMTQSSLGIPDTPADALDYDRVRDWRPGDPLKTIHWKLVAHSQGELYTKLFETPTISAVSLLIDPYGPTGSADAVAHLYDTMLEGGFSLLEHARESGIMGSLRYVNRGGTLVETGWAGPGVLGMFVETARRPSSSQEALIQSVKSIQSLRGTRGGYAIFATSCLTERSVEELITCHHAAVPLLVVHALPISPQSEQTRQRAFDARLREASIDVVELTDGPQIVREMMGS